MTWAVSFASPGSPNSPSSPTRAYTNKTSFQLPIDIAPKDRPAVREVVLWVKEPDGVWMKKDSAPPSQRSFNYHVTKEGEYWFTVVTVDMKGQANPVDVSREPPMLIVSVDLTPPVVEIMPAALANGQPGIRCLIKDANPNYQKLQVSYQMDGKTWMPLEPVMGQTGHFRLPPGVTANGVFRYTAEDEAKNKNSQDIVLQAPGTPPSAIPSSPPANPISPPPSGPSEAGSLPLPKGPSMYTVPDLHPIQPIAKQSPMNHDVLPVSTQVSDHYTPGQSGDDHSKPGNIVPGNSSHQVQEPPAPINLNNSTSLPPAQKPMMMHGSQPRQVLNSPVARIEYRLDKVGRSGVSKVEVWAKSENAATWQRLAVDTSHKSPIEVHMPHEGLFGIRLVVVNGNGYGGNPPGPHDQPTFWIEVDSTPPFAELHPVAPLTNGDSLEIRWTVTDKNLSAKPINLYYASQRNGPWQTIEQGVANTGQYCWHFPHEIGPEIFLRLEVTDEAGNTANSVLNSPVQLDLSEPQADIVGVTGKN
jgi:hypothetical protein